MGKGKLELFNLISQLPGFPGGSDGKEAAYTAGDLGLIPEAGRPPGGRHCST